MEKNLVVDNYLKSMVLCHQGTVSNNPNRSANAVWNLCRHLLPALLSVNPETLQLHCLASMRFHLKCRSLERFTFNRAQFIKIKNPIRVLDFIHQIRQFFEIGRNVLAPSFVLAATKVATKKGFFGFEKIAPSFHSMVRKLASDCFNT